MHARRAAAGPNFSSKPSTILGFDDAAVAERAVRARGMQRGALAMAASYINDERVTCRLPALAGSYDVSSVDGPNESATMVVFDLASIKVIPEGPIMGGSQCL